MSYIWKSFIAAAVVGVGATGVFAQGAEPRLSAIIAGLEDKGYKVLEVDVDLDRIEIEALTADGKRVEIDLNPKDGSIQRERAD